MNEDAPQKQAPQQPPNRIRAANRRQLQDWATTLGAAGIPYAARQDEESLYLVTRRGMFDDAMEEIRLFEQENEGWPPQMPAEPAHIHLPGQSVYHVIFLTLIIFCFYRFGGFDSSSSIHLASTNKPGWLLQGEYWRPITSMTMHADLEHLLWNLLALALFLPAVGRQIGAGTAWFLALAAGAAANITNVQFQDPTFASLGASGAALAGLGLLVGLRFSIHFRQPHGSAIKWRPVAAGLALLGLFSHAPQVDLIGHFLGFLFGVLFGIGARGIPQRWVKSHLQDALFVIGIAVLLFAWSMLLQGDFPVSPPEPPLFDRRM